MYKNPQRFRFQSCSFPVKPLLKLSFYYSCFASLALNFAERNSAIKVQDYHLCRLGCASVAWESFVKCAVLIPLPGNPPFVSPICPLSLLWHQGINWTFYWTRNTYFITCREQSTCHLLSLLSVFSPQLLPHGREVTLAKACNVNILYTKQSNSGNLSVTLWLITRNILVPEIVCQCWGPGMTPPLPQLSKVGVGWSEDG